MFRSLPEQRVVDKNFDLRSYYPYDDIRHFACFHSAGSIDVRGDVDIHDAQLLDPNDDPMQNGFGGEKFAVVVNPRWCLQCLARRTTILKQGLDKRIAKIDAFTHIEAIRRKEKAYVYGVFQGRVDALTTTIPMDELQLVGPDVDTGVDDDIDMFFEGPLSEDGEEPAALMNDEEVFAAVSPRNGGVQDLINKMLDARLIEGDDELAFLMERCEMRDDEIETDEYHMVLEIELELAQIADREEKKGIEDGRQLQVSLEQRALSKEDVEERTELLEQALL